MEKAYEKIREVNIFVLVISKLFLPTMSKINFHTQLDKLPFEIKQISSCQLISNKFLL